MVTHRENIVRPMAYIVQEVGYYFARDEGVIASGSGVVQPGTVLGQVTATGKYAPLSLTATDGSQTPVAIAMVGGDATASDVALTLTVRDTEIRTTGLIWPEGASDAQKTSAIASLRARGIVAR